MQPRRYASPRRIFIPQPPFVPDRPAPRTEGPPRAVARRSISSPRGQRDRSSGVPTDETPACYPPAVPASVFPAASAWGRRLSDRGRPGSVAHHSGAQGQRRDCSDRRGHRGPPLLRLVMSGPATPRGRGHRLGGTACRLETAASCLPPS